jgi:hypothetical protein
MFLLASPMFAGIGQRPTRVEHLKVPHAMAIHLTLPSNIRLARKTYVRSKPYNLFCTAATSLTLWVGYWTYPPILDYSEKTYPLKTL